MSEVEGWNYIYISKYLSISPSSSHEDEMSGRRKLPVLPLASPYSAPASRRQSRTPSPKPGEMGWIQVRWGHYNATYLVDIFL